MNKDREIIELFRSMTRNIIKNGEYLKMLLENSATVFTGKCLVDDNGNRISYLFSRSNDEFYYLVGDTFKPLSHLTIPYSENDCESDYSHIMYTVNQTDGDVLPAVVHPGKQYIDINITEMDSDLDITSWMPMNIKDNAYVTIKKLSVDVVHTISITIDTITYDVSKYGEYIILQWSKTDNKFSVINT